MIKCLLLFVVLTQAWSQTKVDLRTQAGGIDFRDAATTSPIKTGSTLPSTCSIGQLYFLSNTFQGGNLYGCVAVDSWQVQGTIPVGQDGTLLSTNGIDRLWVALGGDVTGSPEATQVRSIQNQAVSTTTPQTGQALIWDGLTWKASTLAGTAGTITLENQGTLVGTRGVANLVAGFGIVNAINDTGTKLSIQQSVNTAVLLSKATHQSGQALLCATAGTSSNYTCSMSPSLTAYTAGMDIHLRPHVNSAAGAVTLNIDSLGNVPIKRADGTTNLLANDLLAGSLYPVWYDGTNFRLVENPVVPISTLSSRQLCATAGTSSSYTCSMSPSLTAYTTGIVMNLRPHVSSAAGTVTLNIDALGNVPVKRADGTTNLLANDLVSGALYPVWYDGTSFRLVEDPVTSISTLSSRQLCATAGTSSSYTCSMSPSLTAYTTGIVMNLRPHVNSAAGAVTLNINSLGNMPIKRADGTTNLLANDLIAGALYPVWYDGTSFRLVEDPVTSISTLSSRQLCATAGTSSSYTCSMSPSLTAYTTGIVMNLRPHVNSAAGAVTLNINSLGNMPIKRADGTTNLLANDLIAGALYPVWYDGTNFRLVEDPVTSISTLSSRQLCATAGTSSSYTCSMSPSLTAYTTGSVMNLRPHVSSAAGAITLNVDSLGNVPVKRADGTTNLFANDLLAGSLYPIWYDGTSFRLLANPAFPLPSTGTRPTCDSQIRGHLWHTFAAAGSKDEVAVCAKDASNAYAWRILY